MQTPGPAEAVAVRSKVEAHHQTQQGSKREQGVRGALHSRTDGGAGHTMGQVEHPFPWEALPDTPATATGAGATLGSTVLLVVHVTFYHS